MKMYCVAQTQQIIRSGPAQGFRPFVYDNPSNDVMAECRQGSKVSQKVRSGLGNFTKVEYKKHTHIHT